MKLSSDPRGEVWARDTTKFGYRMLQKMGWTEGKGLGANEDGMVQHVAVAKKFDNYGIGVDKTAASKAWQEGSGHYKELLANLNKAYGAQESSQGQATTETKKEEAVTEEQATATEKKKQEPLVDRPKRHLIYTKRLAAKNAANYSKSDMAAILGGVKPVKKDEPAIMEEEEEPLPEDEEKLGGLVTITNTVSIADYFKQKQATLNEKKTSVPDEDVLVEKEETNKREENDKAKKKKRKKKSTEKEKTKKKKKESKKRKRERKDTKSSKLVTKKAKKKKE